MRKWLFGLVVFLLSLPALAAVNLNAATEADLESLPGIGPSKAAAIIQYRTDHGPFKTVDELDDVPGIGPATMANLRPLVTVGPAAATIPADKPADKSEKASIPAKDTSGAAKASGGTIPDDHAEAAGGCSVNINKADEAALMTLPGIGKSKAAAILQDRTDHGPFASCGDLDRVSGIGPATIANLNACCTVK